MDSKIRAVRAGHRGVVTKLLKKFEDIQKDSDCELEEIVTLLELLETKKRIITELNDKILDITTEEDVADEIEETDEYALSFEIKLKHIQKFIDKKQINEKSTLASLNPLANSFSPRLTNTMNAEFSNENCRQPERDEATYIQNVQSTFPHTGYQNHRLPKLELPQFDGDSLKWQTFWDSFESTIHYNVTLTNVQKFSYLKAQLHGSAAQCIEGFALTNANYATAVNLLRERFGQTHKIIHALMKSIMDLPKPTSNLYSLRDFGDKLEAYIRGLESLGQTGDMYGALLVPVILDKLPSDIRMNIVRASGTDNIILEELRRAITYEFKCTRHSCISCRSKTN